MCIFGQFPENLKIHGTDDGYISGFSGMTGAIPSHKILELLNLDALKKRREENDARWGEIFKKEEEWRNNFN